MFRSIFCYAAKMRLHNMITVQERHLSVWFDPNLSDVKVNNCFTEGQQVHRTHLIFCILCNMVKRCYVQFELATFTEFSEASANADKVWPSDRYAHAHRRF